MLQDWEGVVEEVLGDSFVARLRDRSDTSEFDKELAEIPLDDVTPDERPLLKPGAIFYLTIYRRVFPRHERATRLVFRRLPAWTDSMLKSVEVRANHLENFFRAAQEQGTSK